MICTIMLKISKNITHAAPSPLIPALEGSRGQRTGQAEGRSPENTDNCLHEFHCEDLGRAIAMLGGGTHLPRDASGLRGYVCIVGEAEDTEGLNKMP